MPSAANGRSCPGRLTQWRGAPHELSAEDKQRIEEEEGKWAAEKGYRKEVRAIAFTHSHRGGTQGSALDDRIVPRSRRCSPSAGPFERNPGEE
jgi:hypothetical protein